MKKLKILVVDDTEMNRKFLRISFGDDYEVLEAENGKQALELFEENDIDVVITDIFMEPMDGYELIRKIREIEEDMPIIAVTESDEASQTKALDAGADNFICRPFVRIPLQLCVKNVLSKKDLSKKVKELEKSLEIAERELKEKKLMDALFPGGLMGAYLEEGFPYVYCNERMLQYLAYDSEKELIEHINGLIINAIYPDDRKYVTDEIAKQLEESGEYHIEYRMVKKNGTPVWMRDVGREGMAQNGRPIINCIYYDITEERQKQEELQKRYEDQVNYSKMMSLTAVASSMVNLTKGCITLQDTENEDIMEVITQQTPQQGFDSMCVHIPDEKVREEYRRIFQTENIIRDFANGIEHKEIRHPYDGYDNWMESSYNAVRNPRTGDLEVYCFARDVTRQVLQESVNTTLMSHEYEEVMLINASTGEPTILIHDGQSPVYEEQERAKDYNAGLRNLYLKYSADDNPEKAAEAASLQTVTKELETQDIYTISYSRYDKEHHITRKRVSYSYLNQYHRIILCTVQDITNDFTNELKQRNALKNALDQAKRATKAKSDFLARMSHDLRTPMNAIMGLSALTMDDATNPERVRENMSKMRQASDFMIGLVNDILDLVKTEEGSVTLNMEPYAYSEFLLNMKTMFKPQCDEKGIKIKFAEPKLNPVGLTDKMRINQIFFNIMSNAVKYTPPGGSIECNVQNMKKEGNRISGEYVIKDTGIGMSDEFQKHLFEPFVQEDGKVTPELQGSGLGLSITKRLVDLMGGEIEVHSKKEEGTTVIVRMSFELIAEDSKEQKRNNKVKLDDRVLVGKCVLLVEDHPLNAQIARNLLEKKGMIVVYAENGKNAVEKFKVSELYTFDLILMDIRMPELNGLEATRMIREMNRKDATSVPIVAMTANAYDEDIKEAFAAGMNEHLTKPIEPQILYETMIEFLR